MPPGYNSAEINFQKDVAATKVHDSLQALRDHQLERISKSLVRNKSVRGRKPSHHKGRLARGTRRLDAKVTVDPCPKRASTLRLSQCRSHLSNSRKSDERIYCTPGLLGPDAPRDSDDLKTEAYFLPNRFSCTNLWVKPFYIFLLYIFQMGLKWHFGRNVHSRLSLARSRDAKPGLR